MMQSFKKLKTALIISGGLFLSFSIAPQSFAKEYYKWVDSKGSTHYSATPPPPNAKHKTTIETYGHNTSSSATSALPVNAPSTQTAPPTVEPPHSDQQNEANAALQKGQSERASQ